MNWVNFFSGLAGVATGLVLALIFGVIRAAWRDWRKADFPPGNLDFTGGGSVAVKSIAIPPSMADACTALKAEQEAELANEAAVIGGHASDCKVALMEKPLRPHAWLECTCGALVRPANVVRVSTYARKKAAPRQKGAPK